MTYKFRDIKKVQKLPNPKNHDRIKWTKKIKKS